MPYFELVAATDEDTVIASYEPLKKRSESYQSEAELEAEFIRMLTEQGYEYLQIHSERELIANLRTQLEAYINLQLFFSQGQLLPPLPWLAHQPGFCRAAHPLDTKNTL